MQRSGKALGLELALVLYMTTNRFDEIYRICKEALSARELIADGKNLALQACDLSVLRAHRFSTNLALKLIPRTEYLDYCHEQLLRRARFC